MLIWSDNSKLEYNLILLQPISDIDIFVQLSLVSFCLSGWINLQVNQLK